MKVMESRIAGWAGVAAFAAICGPGLAQEAPEKTPEADIVILGEVHGNPDHHRWQAESVAALQPAAIVFEMLLPEQAAAVTPAVRDDPEALEAALGWEARGWPDFALYHPIFVAAPDALIVAGDVPRDRVRAAISDGAASVFAATFDADPAAFALGTPLPTDEQAAREALQATAHCDALPEAMLPGMVEAQRLRDAALARAALQAHADTGGPVAVITGTGHARTDWGVPALLAIAAPQLSVLAVGQVESDPGADAPFDLVRVTDPVPRDDPCAAFH